jgi:hypothetical protein
MSCIIIGDIHGRRIWETILAKHPKDIIVFLGDYFDSKEGHSCHDQMVNFQNILTAKHQNPENIIVLTGNHDFHYMPFAGERYSGFQRFEAYQISKLLIQAYQVEALQMIFQYDNFLISHAGLTQTWCRAFEIPFDNPVQKVENLWTEKPETFRFRGGTKSEVTGNEPEQGPLWVRPPSLLKDKLPDFRQVVGHTQQTEIKIMEEIILTDCLGFTEQYFEITPSGLGITRNLI